MSFQAENIPNFLALFESVKPKIQDFPGCKEVQLLQDAEIGSVYYTHSIWINTEALENYRNSEFFKETWAKTKPLFNDKPRAYSLVEPID